MKMVIKIGSAVLVDSRDSKIDREVFANIIEQIVELKEQGHSVVVVTSGAVASSGNRKYSGALNAAIGQPRLMKFYDDFFGSRNVEICQLLVTYEDIESERHKHIKKLLLECIESGVVPIINANDAVSHEELDALRQYADNDVLAGKVASLIGADSVFILTDQKGLVDFKSGNVVREVEGQAEFNGAKLLIEEYKSSVGKGGMASKIEVAENLCKLGIEVRLLPGRQEDVIIDSLSGDKEGTIFKAFKHKKRP